MARRDRLIRQSLRSRFLVTLHSGEAFEGVLLDFDESSFVLADATAVSPTGDRATVDGHLWLPRSGVVYLQDAAPSRIGWAT